MVGGGACLLGCRRDGAELLVFAAASLAPFLEASSRSFRSSSASLKLRFNFGGSARLARQLLAAPRGDLFVSAGRHDLAELIQAKLVTLSDTQTLFGNRLALVAPKGSKQSSADPRTLLLSTDSVISIADPEAAPLGRYTKAWLSTLSPTLWQQLSPRLSPMPDARAALAQVERRPNALGIVYRSDALSSPGLEVLHEVGDKPRIEYVAAVINGRPHAAAAREFMAHLSGQRVRRLYRKLGFVEAPAG